MISRIAQVLDAMLERRIPAGFASLGKHFSHFAVFIGKAEVSFRDAYAHSTGMIVQTGFFVGPVRHR